MLLSYRHARFDNFVQMSKLNPNEKDIILTADIAVKKLVESVKGIVDRLVKKDQTALKDVGKIKDAEDFMMPLTKSINDFSMFRNNEFIEDVVIDIVKKCASDILTQLDMQLADQPHDHFNVIESQLKKLYDQLSLATSKI